MAKYEVSWYENFGGPPKFRDEGEFDTADEALRCAHRIIDESLEGCNAPGRSARDLLLQYQCFGEVPSIFNHEGLECDPYEYVYRRIRELTGETDWAPP